MNYCLLAVLHARHAAVCIWVPFVGQLAITNIPYIVVYSKNLVADWTPRAFLLAGLVYLHVSLANRSDMSTVLLWSVII
jgi:hypothetical protein